MLFWKMQKNLNGLKEFIIFVTKRVCIALLPSSKKRQEKASSALPCSDLYYPSLIDVATQNGQGRASTSSTKQAGKRSAETLSLWLLIYYDKQLNPSFQNAPTWEAKRGCGNVREAVDWLAVSTGAH